MDVDTEQTQTQCGQQSGQQKDAVTVREVEAGKVNGRWVTGKTE